MAILLVDSIISLWLLTEMQMLRIFELRTSKRASSKYFFIFISISIVCDVCKWSNVSVETFAPSLSCARDQPLTRAWTSQVQLHCSDIYEFHSLLKSLQSIHMHNWCLFVQTDWEHLSCYTYTCETVNLFAAWHFSSFSSVANSLSPH